MFHMQTMQENIREGNFHFPSYSISISQSSVDTTGKLEMIGKITLHEWNRQKFLRNHLPSKMEGGSKILGKCLLDRAKKLIL